MLDPKMEQELRSNSKRASIATLVGVLFIGGALVFSVVKLNSLSTAIKVSEQELSKNNEQLAGLKGRLDESQKELTGNQETLSRVRGELSSTDAQLKETVGELEKAKDELLGATRKKEEVERQKTELSGQIEELTRNRTRLEEEIRTLEKQWGIASEQLSRSNSAIENLPPNASATMPLESVIRPRALAMPLGRDKGFLFKLWIDAPEERKVEVKQVSYYFNHPSFGENQLLKSTEPANNFEVQYKGHGAMDRVILTVHDASGGKHKLAFNMYAAVKGDGSSGASPGLKEAPRKDLVPLIDKPRLTPKSRAVQQDPTP